MKIIEPSFEILDDIDGAKMLTSVERSARICYKSEHLITDDSAAAFIKRILQHGHESTIEHEKITVKIICDRGVTHELVRHRIASYSQESTRYCNYANDKFQNEITVIKPCFWDENSEHYAQWQAAMQAAEDAYIALINSGATAQEARAVLPNSLKTEIIVTMNLRAWRHFFRLRTAKASHPQMREIACMMLQGFQAAVPVLFDDLGIDDEE